jgi:hypothetical protein
MCVYWTILVEQHCLLAVRLCMYVWSEANGFDAPMVNSKGNGCWLETY